MNICIFGASSNKIKSSYIEEVEKVSKELAKRGHTLVFGGGATGVMGAAARGFHAGGGKIIGVVPRLFKKEKFEALYEDCTRIIYTKHFSRRKRIMEDRSDIFIIGPGGIGTYDEFFEVYTLKQLGVKDSEIIVFNIDGFYDPMIEMINHADREKFLREGVTNLYYNCKTTEEVLSVVDDIVKNQSAKDAW